MFGKLLPQNVDFFLFFETHIEIAKKSSELLLKMIQTHTNYSNEILITEKEADRVTQQCIEALHQTFITPIERHDIQRLMSKMDDIVDMIEEIASKLVIYQLHPHEHEIVHALTPYSYGYIAFLLIVVKFYAGPCVLREKDVIPYADMSRGHLNHRLQIP